MNRAIALVLLTIIPGTVLAEGHQPYAAISKRPLKALSEQQAEDLRAGRGMGLALAAELNGYPGPTHVLEHAEALNLSGEQRVRTEALFQAMRGEAVPLGNRLLEQEAALDNLFARREVTPESLSAAIAEIGATQAALRHAHLKYHLSMMDVLSPDQVARYGALRGYGQPTEGLQDGHGHHQ